MNNQKKAFTYAFAATGFWSTVASVFKITLRFMAPEQMLLYSSIFSLIILSIVLHLQGKWNLLLSSDKNEIIRSAILGFLNPFLYYIILFRAYSLLMAQEAMTLNYIWPVMLMLLSVPLLHEKPGVVSIFAALISFSGVAVIATKGNLNGLHFSNPAGVFLALSSSIVWAFSWISGMRDKRDETVRLFMNFVFGTAYIVLYNIITGSLFMPSIPGLAGCMYIGFFEMGITFIAWSLALRFAENTASVSNLVFLTPFVSLLFISVITGEHISLSTFSGLLLIITGIMMQNNIAKKRTKNNSD